MTKWLPDLESVGEGTMRTPHAVDVVGREREGVNDAEDLAENHAAARWSQGGRRLGSV